ncbi:MAG: polyprenyl synthetase family protein [Saprospiraceae bacterium]|nr:polyprenyl synthetase family protein [Saprospiraceae bacterium]
MHSYQELLHKYLDYQNAEAPTYKPTSLYEPVRYILSLGGKRIRPVATMMSYELYKDDVHNVLPIALSVETFHNFTLVHDDIMDDAPLRRGMSTVHSKWNINTGILSGDVMLILAYEKLLSYPDAHCKALIACLTKAAREVCEGQQLDIDFENTFDVSIDDYIEMISLKTSVLLAASLQMGAIAADASLDDQLHLYEFGKNIGIAFQLQDDYLDTFGDPNKIGKRIGGDIIQNKKTFLIIKALSEASSTQRSELLHLYSKNHNLTDGEKVNAVVSILNDLNIPHHFNQYKYMFLEKAFANLEALTVESERKKPLIKLANELIIRES